MAFAEAKKNSKHRRIFRSLGTHDIRLPQTGGTVSAEKHCKPPDIGLNNWETSAVWYSVESEALGEIMLRKTLVCAGSSIAIWCILASIPFPHEIAEGTRYLPLENSVLSEVDKGQLSEALKLKNDFGEIIWPGFSEAVIPFLIYNEEWQFLVGHPDPPLDSWEKVNEDLFEGSTYFRQTPAQHVAFLLHEAMHAFQAMEFSQRFERALSAYGCEKDYPFEDEAFSNVWNEEGLILAKAYAQKDLKEMKVLALQFLEHREKRRASAGLAAELLAFERDLEWLEGLGKYAEIRFAELASREIQDEKKAKGYRVAFNRARADMSSRLPRLGEQSGDLRFYLSGAVQAILLDRLQPEWKVEYKKSDSSLEKLLAQAVGWPDR